MHFVESKIKSIFKLSEQQQRQKTLYHKLSFIMKLLQTVITLIQIEFYLNLCN